MIHLGEERNRRTDAEKLVVQNPPGHPGGKPRGWPRKNRYARVKEMAPATVATPAATYRLAWIPDTRAPLVASAPARARKVVNTAPVIPTPSTIPRLRASASTPAAMPCRCRGAAPIKALLFGDVNSPMPSPTI